jgi:hypothetical protein
MSDDTDYKNEYLDLPDDPEEADRPRLTHHQRREAIALRPRRGIACRHWPQHNVSAANFQAVT